MKVIAPANESVLAILKRFLKTDFQGRLSHYCVAEEIEDGVLLFNLMTREMVLLTEEEYGRATELDYLRQRWFVVPEQMNEKECMEFVRLFVKAQNKNKGEITGYTIFTTTDCNARCFYCYELGRSRIPMSEETAHKAGEYIVQHCGGKPVRLTWYGGEPLMNPAVIDIICNHLRQAGIAFKSIMITNGYLLDDAMAKKAVEDWNIQKMQISLDGTEEIYNRVKAFVYSDTNPYQVVLSNIRRVLDLGVKVAIRMNLDLHNAEDLLVLADDLAAHFPNERNLRAYCYHLFKSGTSNADNHTDEEWLVRGELADRLNQKLASVGLAINERISPDVRQNHCMADRDDAITILPDGNIGLCDHFSESEFIGHLDWEGFDAKMAASWKELADEIPECADCFYFPECFKIKKCMSEELCYPAYRRERLKRTKLRMRNTYRTWRKTGTQVEAEDEFVYNTHG